ncbi:MAG: zinc-binding dehydrogenase [Candidatus Omnitrophica bacterium]|nr:zinc-binding dehydrogenase [Candidatus Omnitrophota bacterium]
MKTLAAVLSEINKPLKIEELSIPQPRDGQALVKIAYSGICHSQLNEIRGLRGEDKFLPHTLGHEGSGIVEAAGAGVKKVKAGDRVVLTWIKGIGADIPSSSYKNKDGLTVNSGAISTFMTRTIISENRLVKIPDEMPLREAALLGCAIPTGAGIVINMMDISRRNSIAIFGMGGIGLSALLAAKIKGASVIIAIDVSEDRLKQASLFGATHTLNAANENVIERIMKITDKKGVDYSIESAGRKEVMETAFKSVHNGGGLCIIAGNLAHGQTIQMDPFDLIRGKRIIGTWGGQTQPDRDIPVYTGWALSGKLDLKRLICRTYALKEINGAIDYAEQHAVGRVLIDMGER